MSNHTRALIIGLIGPAISGFGLAWIFLDAVLDPTPEKANLRYFLFDSAHMVVAIGVLVSALCTPFAIRVALASPEETEFPVFEKNTAAEAETEPAGEEVPRPKGRLVTE